MTFAATAAPVRSASARLQRLVLQWGVLLLFLAVTAAAISGAGGGAIRIVFTATAFAVAVVYYVSSTEWYYGFTLWMWFLVPMLRRMVDWRHGYDPHSPMTLVPVLVSIISVAGVLFRLPGLLRRSLAPFLLIFAALIYGLLMGMLRNGVQATLYTFATWVTPVLFGLNIALRWREYPAIRSAILAFIPWAVLVTGVYGMVQWVHPLSWDVKWQLDAMTASSSFGSPVPYQIRVFSTLNGPAPFGLAIGAALLLLFVRPGKVHLFAGAAGVVAFLLSLCRTAWLAWIVALAIYATSLSGRLRLRILLVGSALVLVVGGVVLAAPLDSNGRVAQLISRRVNTLFNLSDDISMNARSTSVSQYVDAILDHPAGYGLGSTGTGTALSGATRGEGIRDFDNGVLETFYSLGLLGGICWMLGLLLLVARHVARRFPSDFPFANANRSVVFFGLIAFGSLNSAIGPGGLMFWMALGLCAAAGNWTAIATTERLAVQMVAPAGGRLARR